MKRMVSVVPVLLVVGLILSGCSQGQINELEAQIAEKDAQIADLNSTVEAKDATIAELGEKNVELQKGVDRYENIVLESYVSIAYDDGTSDGDWALGPPKGHLVHFSPPVIPFTIDAIRIYGSLYGTGYEKLSAEIEVWDQDFKTLNHCEVPHTIFGVEPDWVAIETPGVVVNSDFYVFVFTNSRAAGGIRLHYDSSVKNTHSEVTWKRKISDDWYLEVPKERVNWMIQVEQGEVKGSANIAKIEISFTPDIPKCKAGSMTWRIVLTETNGVGVTFTHLVGYYRVLERGRWSKPLDVDYYDRTINPLAWPYRLPPNWERDSGAGKRRCFSEERHYTYVFFGEDDNGNDVVATGTFVVNKRNK